MKNKVKLIMALAILASISLVGCSKETGNINNKRLTNIQTQQKDKIISREQSRKSKEKTMSPGVNLLEHPEWDYIKGGITYYCFEFDYDSAPSVIEFIESTTGKTYSGYRNEDGKYLPDFIN